MFLFELWKMTFYSVFLLKDIGLSCDNYETIQIVSQKEYIGQNTTSFPSVVKI